jgi:serine/threonine protein kinase
MIGTLLVIAGPDTNTKYTLEEKQTLVIGRGADTTTKLKDPEVSRRHCQIQQDGNTVVLTDIGSAAGTVVNGNKVTRHVLKSGDIIHIGGTQLRWLAGSGSEHDASTMMVKPPSAEDHQVHVDAMMHLVGQKLSHYTIGSVIARGNSSIIFKATDDDDNNQVVALKVLSPTFTANDEERQRFVRAMKTMLPIKHPNIVTILAAGRQVDHCWMAMEYVEGESLNKVIDRIGVANMLDWRYALAVGIQISRALEHAHKNNIIHRNITPTNILMRKADKVAKLSDLMLAKALEGTNALQVTKPGELLGELPFMSPERTQGASATVDGRSDLYGLGATMYALVTGRPPVEGTSLIDTVQKIRNVEPAKPKKFQLSIPEQFEGILMQLLAKRPSDRMATATDLLHSLERVAKLHGVTV